MDNRLTTGRTGRILALALLVGVLLVAWVGVAAPLLDWHEARRERLEQRTELARRMARVAAQLPLLQRAAAAAAPAGPAATPLLAGATDAIAAATLQERVQDMARASGATLGSAETVPATPAGAYRQIALHVAVTAPWPGLVRLLLLLEQASPPMLVDDLQLHATRLAGAPDRPLEAGFTVIAFRAGDPVAAARP